MTRRHSMKSRLVVFAALFALSMAAAQTASPSAPPHPGPTAVRTADRSAPPTIWQGIVTGVGPDGFEMTVDQVWAPVMRFDLGSRTIHVTDRTVFDPPVWNIGNLATGEDVSVTILDAKAERLVASTVTVVDPD